jgi:DNA repair exonuclease SbcCD ATPase subunit
MRNFKLKMKSSLFYQIINIISLAFVIISLILAFLLYNRRKDLLEINNKMTSAISKITVTLDSGSGATYSNKLPVNGMKDVQALVANLKNAEKQAQSLVTQKNNMGKALAAISTNLQLPVNFTTKQFQSLKTYRKTVDSLVQFSKKVNDRNNSLIDCFVNIANVIQDPIENEAAFKSANKNLQGDSEALNKLIENVKLVSNELNSAKKQLINNNSKIKKLEQGLLDTPNSSGKEVQSLIAEYEKQLEELQKENADLTNSINENQTLTSSRTVEQIETMHPNKKREYENKLKAIKSRLYLKLSGKVLKYDKKWGFAIIDLGKFNKVDFSIDGKKEAVTVALPLNKEMYVSRGNEFIAKVNISKVVDKYAVVNLISPSDSVIQPGDKVFFPVKPDNVDGQ